MARLALGVAGAVIGAPFGVPGLGFAIGSALGTQFFSPTIRTQGEGPRLGDQNITVSTYGASIPIGYGTMKFSGNIIWQEGRTDETVVKVEETSGKGGQTQQHTQTTYQYFNSFAVGFAEGPANTLMRLWIDEKLVYDAIDSSLVTQLKNALTFRFYTGSEIQTPDSLISSVEGVNDTPAFRGLCYIVFERLALVDFANRDLPQVKAEITFEDPGLPIASVSKFLDVNQFTGNLRKAMFTDEVNSRVYYFLGDSLGAEIVRSNISTLVQVDSKSFVYVATGHTTFAQGFAFDHVGDIYVTSVQGGGGSASANVWKLSKIDLSILLTKVATGESFDPKPVIVGAGFKDGFSVDFPIVALYHSLPVSARGVRYLNGTDLSTHVSKTYLDNAFAPNVESNNPISIIPGISGQNFQEFHVITIGYEDPAFVAFPRKHLTLYKTRLRNTSGTITQETVGFKQIQLETFLPDAESNWTGTTAFENSGKSSGIFYFDEDDNTIIFTLRKDVHTATRTDILRIEIGTGKVLWHTAFEEGIIGTSTGAAQVSNSPFRFINSSVLNRISKFTNNLMWFVVNQDLKTLNIKSGVISEGIQDWSNGFFGAHAAQMYVTTDKAIVSIEDDTSSKTDSRRGLIDAGAGVISVSDSSVDLATVVNNISSRVSLISPTDINTAALVGISVPGFYHVQAAARIAIEGLMLSYQFDVIESDFKLICKLRGGSSIASLIERDLVPIDKTTHLVVQETRIQEVELPEKVEISFIERDNEYSVGLQYGKRILLPTPAMRSNNSFSVSIPLVQQSTFIKQLAEKILYQKWLGRFSYKLMASWKWIILDPSDIITVTLDSGTIFTIRIEKVNLIDDLTIDIVGVSEDATLYTSTTTADKGSGQVTQVLTGVPDSNLFLMNIPLLRNSDDILRVRSLFYYGMTGKGSEIWPGAQLLKSNDDVDWTVVGRSVLELKTGTTINVLGSPVTAHATDFINSLQITFDDENVVLSSITQLQMLDGGNPLILINSSNEVEIIQYRDVTQTGTSTWKLENLLRGRRGTNFFINGHEVNETVIIPESSTLQTLENSISEVSVSRSYRGVTFGQLLEEVTTDTFAATGNDLKPYPPDHGFISFAQDDRVITWRRRTRIDGAFRTALKFGNAGIVPLNEDIEKYEIDILDAPGGTVKRTATNLLSPTYTYTSADQTTDFGGLQTTLHIVVYQVSGQIGRGFPFAFTDKKGTIISGNTGFLFPGTVFQEPPVVLPPFPSGGQPYLNSDGIKVDDNSTADANGGGANDTYILSGHNYGFNISSGAAIVGVEAEVEVRRTSGSAIEQSRFLFDKSKSGINKYIGTNQSTGFAATASLVIYTFGSPTDLWGTTNELTVSFVNSSDFGFSQGWDEDEMQYDFYRMKVYFSQEIK